MKHLLLFSLILGFSPSIWANEEYRFFDSQAKAEQIVLVVEHKGLKVSTSCRKKDAFDCMALKTKAVREVAQDGAAFLGHPASKYCTSVGGKNRILQNSKKEEFDFCLFEDGSMVESWSLFSKGRSAK